MYSCIIAIEMFLLCPFFFPSPPVLSCYVPSLSLFYLSVSVAVDVVALLTAAELKAAAQAKYRALAAAEAQQRACMYSCMHLCVHLCIHVCILVFYFESNIFQQRNTPRTDCCTIYKRTHHFIKIAQLGCELEP
jgi:hypothetical protein